MLSTESADADHAAVTGVIEIVLANPVTANGWPCHEAEAAVSAVDLADPPADRARALHVAEAGEREARGKAEGESALPDQAASAAVMLIDRAPEDVRRGLALHAACAGTTEAERPVPPGASERADQTAIAAVIARLTATGEGTS